MSHNKMLIDATHPEETRVVVLRNGRVEEFDYESAARKILRGNIYLAKVTRVEPSLQAAFVDYGGNRHGFLAFNEIHPDYYQIPMADRQALLEQEAAEEAAEDAAADAHAERMARRRQQPGSRSSQNANGESPQSSDADYGADNGASYPHDDDEDHQGRHETMAESSMAPEEVVAEEPPEPETVGGFEPSSEGDGADNDDEPQAVSSHQAECSERAAPDAPREIGLVENEGVQEVPAAAVEIDTVEQTGTEDALEELPSRPRRRPRSYKIQEVIKRRQVILVQVVKEERGNKGAALTTYLSLAGRYTVLMPNTARGGGISRKITNPQDRKRLKAIAEELEVPEGMGLIIRTAGAARTKQEIKRDFEYLLRLWESVRDLTLQSTAPSLVYEEGNLIKRSIRDLYNKDVEEIVVAGEHAHREAKDFMRMLMPSHTKNVIQHCDPEPLFTKYGIERQLNAMFSPYVTLRSGGYLVINQTEALVAIDVNSGKSTREFSIEETAYNTNLEASDEIARQLKLRDLAGLVVIDFIDMEEKRNSRAVERRLKDALRFDRARIQLGRISHFGLMEMSRQRLRTGVLEGSTSQCAHCQGTGIIRSTESVALAVIRGLEDTLLAGARTSLVATTTAQVALYILNNKRAFINDMEARNGVSIAVQASDKLQGANFTIEKGAAPAQPVRHPERNVVNMDWGFEGEGEGEAADASGDHDQGSHEAGSRIIEIRDDEDADREGSDERREGRESREGGRRRRRRRGRGRRDGQGGSEGNRDNGFGGEQPAARFEQPVDDDDVRVRSSAPAEFDDADAGPDDEDASPELAACGDGQPHSNEDRSVRRRRRGRRGGRRGRDRNGAPEGEPAAFGAEHVTELTVDDFSGAAGGSNYESDLDEQPPAPVARRPERPTEQPNVVEQPVVPVISAPVISAAASQTIASTERAAAEPDTRRARAKYQTTAGEPKIERVRVAPDEVVAVPEPSAVPAGAPSRKGWWQRKLSGG